MEGLPPVPRLIEIEHEVQQTQMESQVLKDLKI